MKLERYKLNKAKVEDIRRLASYLGLRDAHTVSKNQARRYVEWKERVLDRVPAR